MSLETRSNSALFKRAEQLKRWEDSDTNREPVSPKVETRKIKFSSGCVFLAACAAGEKEEVLRLLEKGADIDTANVDGLTALHQACIDDNLDMVEFLVEHGADVNRGDNEGWTPLHATASCGFLSIAKYLIEHGANVAAVNCDGELALDIAECEAMENLLQAEIVEQGIDCDQARSEEERLMLKDAKEWLSTNSPMVDVGNSKTGATALHVASAKGYVDVMKILFQCGADVDKQDVDGWTPLHAAAHWGQKEASKILVDNLTDMDAKNFVGQTPFDLADADMYKYLMDLKTRQNKEEVNKRQAKKRLEVHGRTLEAETPTKVKRVEVEIENKEEKVDETIGMEVSSESETESSSTSSDDDSSSSEAEVENDKDEKKNRVNAALTIPTTETITPPNKEATENIKGPPSAPPKQITDTNMEDSTPSWRRPNSRPPTKVDHKLSSNSFRNKNNVDVTNENEVQLRRTNSFQNDPAFYERYWKLRARIQAASFPPPSSPTNNVPTTPTTISCDYIIAPSNNLHRQYRNNEDSVETTSISSSTTTTSTTSSPTKTTTTSPAASPLPNSQPVRSGLKLAVPPSTTAQSTATTPTTPSTPATPTTPGGTRLTMIKNFFKSFVPPVRDEESETQRKAHAKRVRETRRSTQGVTLEEIKSAEQLVKMKNQATNNNNNEQSTGANGDPSNGVSVTATITTATPTVITREASAATEEPTISHERRPSWRLRVDNGSKFKLEDVNKVAEPPSTPSFIRRPAGLPNNPTPRPSSAPVETAETTVTLPLRRPKTVEEKEQDKENDARNAQATLATQAAIQRRRRPKRRSTGVVAFDNLDDIDQEKDHSQGGGGDCEDTSKMNHQESGNDRSSRGSRIGSSNDLILRGENGEIDYKRLYEQALSENDRLKEKLRKSDDELRETKQTLEKLNTVTSKNSLSELEKRERRAMERKLSEMEEELKQLEILKNENQRLKDENGALIRVISKLSK